jgi:hypothetical protein
MQDIAEEGKKQPDNVVVVVKWMGMENSETSYSIWLYFCQIG